MNGCHCKCNWVWLCCGSLLWTFLKDPVLWTFVKDPVLYFFFFCCNSVCVCVFSNLVYLVYFVCRSFEQGDVVQCEYGEGVITDYVRTRGGFELFLVQILASGEVKRLYRYEISKVDLSSAFDFEFEDDLMSNDLFGQGSYYGCILYNSVCLVLYKVENVLL